MVVVAVVAVAVQVAQLALEVQVVLQDQLGPLVLVVHVMEEPDRTAGGSSRLCQLHFRTSLEDHFA